MHALVEDALLGQLVVNLLLSGVLELGVCALALRIVVRVVMVVVAMPSAASDCLRYKGLQWFN
jgi:hypothetical protein